MYTNNTNKKEINEIIEKLYKPLNLKVTNVIREKEGKEYDAHKLNINDCNILYRAAKTTPTKLGQFVTLWKRINNKTTPYTKDDPIDIAIIDVSTKNNSVQFIFPKNILIEKGILASDNNIGKMAFRVYPLWDIPISKQAIKTKKWQLKYFFSYEEITQDNKFLERIFNT